jgi:hypothetical protein
MPLAHRRRCGGPWMWRPQRRRRRGRSRWEPAAPGRDSWTLPREADAAVNLDRSFGNTPRSCCCVGPGPMPSRSDAQRCFATARCRTCSRHERSASRMVRPSSATLRGYRGSFVAKDVGERALIAVRTSRGSGRTAAGAPAAASGGLQVVTGTARRPERTRASSIHGAASCRHRVPGYGR